MLIGGGRGGSVLEYECKNHTMGHYWSHCKTVMEEFECFTIYDIQEQMPKGLL